MKKTQSDFSYSKERFITNVLKVNSIYSAFETTRKSKYKNTGELHQFWKMVYVFSGNFLLARNNKIYQLRKNDISFFKPMDFHTAWAFNDAHVFTMYFNISGDLKNNLFTLTDHQKSDFFDLFNYLKEHTSYPTNEQNITYFLNNWNDTISQNIATRLELFLLSFAKNNELIFKNEFYIGRLPIYKQVFKILAENVYTWISSEEIAKRCNISKTQLNRHFAINSPISIHQCFIKMKISEATKLLLSGLSVTETSEKLEFSSPFYFSTVFKRETGLSPRDYKKNNSLI